MSEPGQVAAPVVVPSQTLVFPSGSDPDDLRAVRFCLTVSRVAKDTWMVHQDGTLRYLRTDGTWTDTVTSTNWDRFVYGTHEAAVAAAITASERVLVDGLTWQQWERTADAARTSRAARWSSARRSR